MSDQEAALAFIILCIAELYLARGAYLVGLRALRAFRTHLAHKQAARCSRTASPEARQAAKAGQPRESVR